MPPQSRVSATSMLGRLTLALAALTGGCGEELAPEPSPAPVEEPACGPGTWGHPAYDALVALGAPGEPVLVRDPLEWLDTPAADALAARVEVAARVEPGLPPVARIALQNDVWGLWQRLERVEASSPARTRLLAAAAALIARLAAPTPTPRGPPAEVEWALPSRDGWRDVESEMPVLGHERLFGLRRHFHVRARGRSERALYSTLVAIGPDGRPAATDVVGDIEVLRFEGDRLAHARLFELDRRRLRCEGAGMVETRVARHVPGVGADRFLARFEPPAPLDDLPCARCHEDASTMSLPDPTLPVGERLAPLLEQVRVP